MKLKHYLIILGLLVSQLAVSQSLYPGQFESKLKIKDKTDFKAYAFNLSDIRLLPSRFTENRARASKWLLSISVSRLLHSFQTNAGVFAGKEGGYDDVKKLAGWESLDCDLRGHTTGHILSALAMFYGATQDQKYKIKADSIVDVLSEVQKALGPTGYLSAFPENLIDRCIKGESVWAPWYVLHKILAGLIDQYLYCNNEKALVTAVKMSRWAYNKLKVLNSDQRTVMLRNEFGGINDAFYALYAITGDDQDKWLGDFFYHNQALDLLKTGVDNLAGMHANTYIPKLIGVIRGYDQNGGQDYKNMAEFFWNTVVNRHSFVTGSNSDHEKFYAADQNAHHLTGYTGESCNVYNMLKLTGQLFCLDADANQADYYEKALYNHILGQQDTISGMVAYFLPMLPGAYKVYSTPDSSFWCCVGSGFENQAKYGEGIYFHKSDSLYINLFIPSVLNWRDRQVKIKQQTDFPKNGQSTLTLSMDSRRWLTIHIRYPNWAGGDASVKVNGKPVKIKTKPGTYISLEREWKNGDQIEVNFPMHLKLQPDPGDKNVVSITYGPIVLAAAMGTDNFVPPAPFSNPRLHNDYYTYDYHVPANISDTLSTKAKSIDDWLKPVAGKYMTFETVQSITGREMTFYPLFNMDRQRYIVYWKLQN